MSFMSTLPCPARSLFAVLAATLAPLAPAHDGRQYFEERCAQCHGEDKVIEALMPLATPAAVRQRLEQLLPKHHAVEHEVHEPVIVYLLAQLAAKGTR